MKHAGFIAGIALAAITVTAASAFAETPKPGKHGPRATFEQLDADGDGQVTQAEMEAHRAGRFTEMDTNGDGKLTADEMQAHGQQKAKDRSAKMLEKFDKDGDGALSAEEMPKPRHGDKMFGRIDTDGSGGVSKEEFDAAKAKMKEHGRKGHGKDKKENKDSSEQN
ncbi:EF-hand domain-containing protein [Phaeobacter marinintestinus]|uniref:EF-hand domain-containing protein n=1 Tax=Falsiphaeobacter marinintestinus TaxID=1492905 RepID=UPI0011B4D5C7|nr:EF-hand domain-containing protein [Phaeobacter marinintestinus]